MTIKAETVKEYLDQLPDDRKKVLTKIRKTLKTNLPKGFKETIQYNMPGFVVPHSIYPDGYHVNPKEPLPFINYASQKNFVALYHSGVYGDPKLNKWFTSEYPKHCKTKLDMGKSCVRFKKMEDIPYALIGELAKKITVEDYISLYEQNLKNSRKKG
ncbi:MAG: DUF1801 domain-containing protein [Flavobacteriales bacterium]|nr:DUF1801 domain-containing protein [Flavobacteriales bacterium]